MVIDSSLHKLCVCVCMCHSIEVWEGKNIFKMKLIIFCLKNLLYQYIIEYMQNARHQFNDIHSTS